MSKIGIAVRAALLGAALASVPAVYADGNGNGLARSGAPGHQLGSFRGAQAATAALLAALHHRLAVTSAQESAWQAFANAVVAQATDGDAQAAQAASVTNAVDALNLQASVLHKQADDATAVAQAFTALYALLSPAQRALVDEYFKHGAPI